MEDEQILKMAVIAGASHALKCKRESKYSTDEEIIQKVTKAAKDIISKIDSEE